MIVDCAVYKSDEKPKHFAQLGDAAQEAKKRGRFLWVGLADPSTEEFEAVTKILDLHPLAVEDSLHKNQRPKLERFDDTQFLVMRPARFVDSNDLMEFGEIMVLVGSDFVVTVRHGETNAVKTARARLEESAELRDLGPLGVLYALLDAVVDGYLDVTDQFEPEIDDLERAVFSAVHGEHARQIYELKREILEFRQSVNPLITPLEHLVTTQTGEPAKLFRDVLDHLLRVHDRAESFDSLLSHVLSAHLAQISVRQNEDMRKISAWVAIVAVPTMIAGVYGMNFDHMPELRWKYGYLFSVAIMVAACTGLFKLFRRRGWL